MSNATVVSVGVNDVGKSVVRVRLPSGMLIDVDTNVVSFARLAAAGVPVVNGKITLEDRKAATKAVAPAPRCWPTSHEHE